MVPNDDSSETHLSYEEAMERLETIVTNMESGRMPLEELLTRFDEGTQLAKICEQRLADAARRVEIIARKADGTLSAEPFDPTAPDSATALSPPPQPPAAKKKTTPPSGSPSGSDDEVSLF